MMENKQMDLFFSNLNEVKTLDFENTKDINFIILNFFIKLVLKMEIAHLYIIYVNV